MLGVGIDFEALAGWAAGWVVVCFDFVLPAWVVAVLGELRVLAVAEAVAGKELEEKLP